MNMETILFSKTDKIKIVTFMRYRIEYADGRCCNFANSRKDLLDWLKALKDEKVVDIRKVYKNGVTDSVIDSYRSYLKQ